MSYDQRSKELTKNDDLAMLVVHILYHKISL